MCHSEKCVESAKCNVLKLVPEVVPQNGPLCTLLYSSTCILGATCSRSARVQRSGSIANTRVQYAPENPCRLSGSEDNYSRGRIEVRRGSILD